MADTRDLLREAVGSWEPRGDEGAVERRVARRRRRREVSSAIVALGVFVAGGWLAWTTLGGGASTPGSGAGTYELSGFRVQEHVDEATDGVDPARADVSFRVAWPEDEYPGVHRCRVRVVAVGGGVIGSRSLELASTSTEGARLITVSVTGSIDGAAATGSCSPARLDRPVAAAISGERFGYADGRLSVFFDVEASTGRPAAQACTSAVWDGEGELLGSVSFVSTLQAGTRHVGLGLDEALARAEAAAATVTCSPYVRPGEFSEAELPTPSVSPSTSEPKASVGAPTGAS